MKVDSYQFGEIVIDGETYSKDIVIKKGKIEKRKKKSSKPYKERFGHTPLSNKENIPWSCTHLVIGTGMHGALPVMDEVLAEALKREVEVFMAPTEEVLSYINNKETNLILHLTC